ncbi:GspH/FimT family pseudopilin [Pseudomonas nitroreducens]|uniref:GspH/FimT family pseudopilin n=1 Tax=Pseudomonas TaxID=286 RepID=UPI001CF02E14|nr:MULTISPECIES: GspH/FimT family pseudopilin [Pseudomonas]MDG9853662.1 GspH/FimT family pseudopilin [Pseudomonas nitroreducens]MDH1076069.1 GspH/FimT family pseudopilin [Pseudomonas nitroreducens]UCL88066.1 GspH/FimT family pseudopilin [Pseudomonas sp. HS-18]
MSRRKGSAGFTLIELLIVVTLLAVFASIALPSFQSLIRNNRTQSTANELFALLQYARSEAVTRNLSITATTASGSWVIAQGSTSMRSMSVPPTPMSVRPASATLTFYSNGTASANTDVYVCQDGNASNGFLISVKASGMIKLWPRGKSSATEALGSCGS